MKSRIERISRGIPLFFKAIAYCVRYPRQSLYVLLALPSTVQGREFKDHYNRATTQPAPSPSPLQSQPNALREYFQANTQGPGIWKWLHYFEAYQQHLEKFRGKSPHVVEVGIYSGGSLGMWKHYFGNGCYISGVDIEEACRVYQSDGVAVHIGDQQSRDFWRRFKETAPEIDVFIDDGGHTFEQQKITLEEVLPHLRPGGVYMCEDVHGANNQFLSYVQGLASGLHAMQGVGEKIIPTALQASLFSVHFYPFLVVIEKRKEPLETLTAPRHGTQWQPFFDKPTR